MTRPQLMALGKGHFTRVEMKKLKVEELRAKIIKFVAENPNVIQIPGSIVSHSSSSDVAHPLVPSTSSTSNSNTVAPAVTVQDSGSPTLDIDSSIVARGTCSVLECDSTDPNDVQWCEECNLYFCSELHAPHVSHSTQFLQPGKVAKIDSAMTLTNEDECMNTVDESEVVDQNNCSSSASEQEKSLELDNGGGMERVETNSPVICPRAPSPINPSLSRLAESLPKYFKKRKSAEISSADPEPFLEPNAEHTTVLAVNMKSKDDNPLSRELWEVNKFKKAIQTVQTFLSSKNRDSSTIYNEFKYVGCYDGDFLVQLANEFKVDLSEVTRKKRVQQKDILAAFICKLENL